jgi:hypothetical protein
VAALVAVAVQSAAHFAYVYAFDAEVGQLNIDAEANTWAWISSSVVFAAAVLAVLLALADPGRAFVFLLLAAVLVLFSLDDAVSAHEELGEAITERVGLAEEWVHATWPLIFFPLIGFAFLILWKVSREAPRQVRALVRTGLALLVLAVAAEIVAAAWYVPGNDAETFVGALQITVEEGSELGGWILVATGLAALCVLRIAAAVGRAERL